MFAIPMRVLAARTALCAAAIILSSSSIAFAEQPAQTTAPGKPPAATPSFAHNTSGDSGLASDTAHVFDVHLSDRSDPIVHRVAEVRHGQQTLSLRAPIAPVVVRATQILDEQTSAFMVKEGDTIAFYRELRLPASTEPAFGKTLTADFTVELLDAATRRRVVMVDSVGVVADPTGSTRVYGMHPQHAVVRYIVPHKIGSVTVVLRRRSIARSDGRCQMKALASVGSSPSRSLSDPKTLKMRRKFGQGLEHRDATQLENARHGRHKMSVITEKDKRSVTIEFPYAAGEGVTTVVLYDINGNQRSVPAIVDRSPVGVGTINVTNSGGKDVYAALYHDNLLVGSARLTPDSADAFSAVPVEE